MEKTWKTFYTLFNQLTVIEQLDERNKKGSVQWKCECSCGREAIVSTCNLLSGHVTSCGCAISAGENAIREYLEERCIEFEQQKKFDDCCDKKSLQLLNKTLFMG